ncbi:hypothetical protein [Haladaptatus halobius]|uniref:hypothetical protein n=1 Tax=Haladaptatus halobius TaxID=2884875 RepID=UPI001D0A3293|nr:hypothetical protein [Haladaptatus halobius]
MSNDESNLEQLLTDGMERIQTALDAVEDDELPDEKAESVHDTVDAIDEEIANASLDELLTATGFANVSDDIAPTDLPIVMQDADPDAVLDLRRVLELADLSNEWSNLDAEERVKRLQCIGGDETSSASERSVSDLLSAVLPTFSSDEETTTEARNKDEVEGDETEAESEDDEEDESSSTEKTIAKLRSLFDAAGLGEKDNTDEETVEEPEEEQDSGHGGSDRGQVTTNVSTMPSSRPDMGRSTRHSTISNKN